MPMFVKNGQSDEQPYDAFECREDSVRRQEVNDEDEDGWAQGWRDRR